MSSSQGQKIIAALYLVTSHLHDSDPIKLALRQAAVDLIENEIRDAERTAAIITDLLGGAVLAQLVSEKNASIITLEVRRYASAEDEQTAAIETFFASSPVGNMNAPSNLPRPSLSFTSRPMQSNGQSSIARPSSLNKENTNEKKDKRQEQILSFITARTSATIKDITVLFPGVSEKTIQRELGALVAAGRITKRGQKRWSVYMAL